MSQWHNNITCCVRISTIITSVTIITSPSTLLIKSKRDHRNSSFEIRRSIPAELSREQRFPVILWVSGREGNKGGTGRFGIARVRGQFISTAGWRIAPVYRCSAKYLRYGFLLLAHLLLLLPPRRTRGKESRGDDKGPLMPRYVCSSCSSFRGWYAARQPGRRWPDSGTTGWWWWFGALTVGVALIYRGNRSLFLSRRPSRPPNFDRYRLVIAFRYLNISAPWNLLEARSRTELRELCLFLDASSRYCAFLFPVLFFYRLVVENRFVGAGWRLEQLCNYFMFRKS